MRKKLFIILAKNHKQVDIEILFFELFNNKVNIFSTDVFKDYEVKTIGNNIYLDSKILNLEKKSIVNLLYFFKEIERNSPWRSLILSLIPFILFYSGTLSTNYRTFFFVIGGISISFIQNFKRFFLIRHINKHKISHKSKSDIIGALENYNKLFNNNSPANILKIKEFEKIINEISKS